MLIDISLYLLLGAFAGVLAGLLGVGGGLIIVPMLASIFIANDVSQPIIMHLALGTSLASIIFTSLSSVISHHKKHSVLWSTVIRLTPGILIGAWFGSLSSNLLRPIFAIFELLIAAHLLFGRPPNQHNSSPSLVNQSLSGTVIGSISSIIGIGGGSLSVPWLLWHGKSIHKAIATSAALGMPIAISGSLGYLYTGWNEALLPNYSAGYIYLPALLSIIASSMLFAPLGAHWAHTLPVTKLKRGFALLLILMACHLLFN